ncbi:MAG TPA: alkyl hydroperoxide reductase, partial [Pirellulales bacterium]
MLRLLFGRASNAWRFYRTVAVAFVGGLLSALLFATEPAPAVPVRPTLGFPLLDLQGKTHELGQNDARKVRAFVFLSTTCPIARGYTQTLNELHRGLAAERRGELFGIVSGASETRADAAKHFAEFQAEFPVLFDPSGLLADALQPTHTPEAFVLSESGELVYRGAIDNAWEAIGRRRPQAEKKHLAEAIAAAVAGKPAPVSATRPVGCPIEAAPQAERDASVTYTRDVAPIVFARCLNCHRDGEAAPFSLATYEETASRAEQISSVAHARLMPPWMPAVGHEKFVGDRRLSDR